MGYFIDTVADAELWSWKSRRPLKNARARTFCEQKAVHPLDRAPHVRSYMSRDNHACLVSVTPRRSLRWTLSQLVAKPATPSPPPTPVKGAIVVGDDGAGECSPFTDLSTYIFTAPALATSTHARYNNVTILVVGGEGEENEGPSACKTGKVEQGVAVGIGEPGDVGKLYEKWRLAALRFHNWLSFFSEGLQWGLFVALYILMLKC